MELILQIGKNFSTSWQLFTCFNEAPKECYLYGSKKGGNLTASHFHDRVLVLSENAQKCGY